MRPLIVLLPILFGATMSGAYAQASDADPPTTVDSCKPQPKCRALYTSMEPATNVSHIMMHHKSMKRR